MNKEKQKQLLTEVMNADAKDGLYKQQTAVEWLEQSIKSKVICAIYERLKDEGHFEQAKQMENDQRKEYERNLLNDFSIKVTEYLLNPPFNLEHAQHGIACEKLSILRNNFLIKHYNETYGK